MLLLVRLLGWGILRFAVDYDALGYGIEVKIDGHRKYCDFKYY